MPIDNCKDSFSCLATPRGIWGNFYPIFLALTLSVCTVFFQQIMIAYYDINVLVEITVSARIVSVFRLVVTLITMMTTTLVGQLRGLQKHAEAGSIVWQMIWFSILCLPVFVLIGNCITPLFLSKVSDFSVQYFRISMVFLSINAMVTALEGFFLATGKALLIWISAIIGTVISLGVTYFLLFTPLNIGISGVALAAGVSGCIQLAFLLCFFLNTENKKNYKTNIIKFDFNLLKQNLVIGIPNVISELLLVSMAAFILSLRSVFYKENMSGIIISSYIYYYTMHFIYALQAALIGLVSNFIGAKKWELIDAIIKSSYYYVFSFSVITAILLIVFPRQFLELYNYHFPEFLHQMRLAFAICWFTSFLMMIGSPFYSVLRAAGDTKFLMYLNLFCNLIFTMIPICFLILHSQANVINTWLVWCFSTFLTSFGTYLRYKNKKWKIIPSKIEKSISMTVRSQ